MTAHDRAAAAKARLAQITRELQARRSLRDRSAEQARKQARDSLLKQGPVAEKVAKHLAELGRREKQAGGWVTEKTLADKQRAHVLELGIESEDTVPTTADYPRYAAPHRPSGEPPPTADPATPARQWRAPGNRGHHELDDDDYSGTSWLRR